MVMAIKTPEKQERNQRIPTEQQSRTEQDQPNQMLVDHDGDDQQPTTLTTMLMMIEKNCIYINY